MTFDKGACGLVDYKVRSERWVRLAAMWRAGIVRNSFILITVLCYPNPRVDSVPILLYIKLQTTASKGS